MENEIVLDLQLTNQEVAVVLELLDKQVQGRRLAMLICPIMDKIEVQAQQSAEKIAEQRRQAKKKLEEAQKKDEPAPPTAPITEPADTAG